MINQQYIDSFKSTDPYRIISVGLLGGYIEDVLLGRDNFRITSKYEIEDTDPYQVIITAHILINEGRLSSNLVNAAFNNILITRSNICLLLSYIDNYLWYRQYHKDLELDYENLLIRIKGFEPECKDQQCYNELIKSVHSWLT